jgi:hypothetical protein
MARSKIGFALGSLAVVAIAACSSSNVYPNVKPAWFGATPPSALISPVVKPAGDIPAAIVPAGEGERTMFAGDRIRTSVEQVIGFADDMRREGNQMWGRISGFPSQAKTADWLATELETAGLKTVENQTYKATGEFYWPESWAATVVADPAYGDLTIDVKLASAVPVSGSFIDGTIEAPAVFVGEAGEVTTDGVSGKIAIQHTHPATGAYSDRTKVRESSEKLIQAGAVSVITWVEQAGNMHVFDFGRCGGPCFNIGGADGKFITDAIKAAADKKAPEIKLRLTLKAEMKKGLEAHNVIGVLPGKSPDAIVVNAHIDSWFNGAGDNADGVGVLVALARYFSHQTEALPKTLIFVGSGGHHSAGMNGPGNLVSMNADTLKPVQLVINLEHLAQFQIDAVPEWKVNTGEQPKSFGVSNMSPYLVNLVKTASQRYGFAINPEITNSVPGDLGGYAPLGVARIQGIHSGPLYHTSGDTLDSISQPGLEKAARFYAYIIEQAMTASGKELNP